MVIVLGEHAETSQVNGVCKLRIVWQAAAHVVAGCVSGARNVPGPRL